MDVIDLGFRPRPWQDESYRQMKRFSVLVVHRRGGKTVQAVMRLIDAALKCQRERGRFGYIAPLLGQAKGIAWDYIRHYAAKIPGTIINQAELWIEFPNKARIRIYGADNPESLRGLYFDGLVLDEVAQMKAEIWGEILLPALADRLGWVMFIGTPKGINLFSSIYYSALVNPEWYAQVYTIHDTQALDPAEVERMKATMTEKEFRQEMLCEFSASSDDALISIDEARAALGRPLREDQYNFAPKVMGVDVAWSGGDRSVIMKRQGLIAYPTITKNGLPEKHFAAIVAQECNLFKPDAIFIDTTGGYGGEVLSRLHDSSYPATGVVFSSKPLNERFLNLRAEMWFKMADWIKSGGSIPKENDLLNELCAVTYGNDNAANKLKLESKEDVKKRLGMSPDKADALALTWAYPVFPLTARAPQAMLSEVTPE